MNKLQTIEIEHPMQTARIRVPPVEMRKGLALSCEELGIGYADKMVADRIRFEIERGEHVAVLGDNGEGKTTFLRTIAGQLTPRSGHLRWGHNQRRAYYAQHIYATLDPERDVLSTLEQEASRDLERQAILDLAGSFLFQGDDVYKPVSVLSGGERARLCLAGLLLSQRPVFLLDEPTNHLDFETVEVLAAALRDYAGTMFFTSHDRTFVNLVATSILEVRGGAIKLYPHDYETYVYRMQREIEEDASVVGEATKRAAPEAKPVSDYHRRKEHRARVRKAHRDIERVEREMAAFEEEAETINRHYLENPTDYAPEKQARLEELKRRQAEAEQEWLGLHEELEELETQEGP